MAKSRVAIVLYSYGKRRDRQRLLFAHSLSRISRQSYTSVYITVGPGEASPDLPGITSMHLDIPPGYEHLPDKTIAMLRWLAGKPEWDYVIKCDDDVLLDPSAVCMMSEQRSLPDYQSVATCVCSGTSEATYHKGKCLDPKFNARNLDTSWGAGMPFAAGQCYVLSRRAVVAALEEIDSGSISLEAARAQFDIRGVGGEDLLVAYLLRQRGISPVESLRIFQSKPRPRALFRHLFYESVALFRNHHRNRICIGAVTDNRDPWWGEYSVIRAWFFLSHFLERLLGRRPPIQFQGELTVASNYLIQQKVHGG